MLWYFVTLFNCTFLILVVYMSSGFAIEYGLCAVFVYSENAHNIGQL